MVFDAEVRELFASIAQSKGLKLELEPVGGSVKHKEKNDFIIDNQRKKIAENDEAIVEQQSQLENISMKIKDVEAVVDEAVDLAYEKAVEAVTEEVKEETVKHDVEVVKDYKKWLVNDSDSGDKAKTIGAKILDNVVARIEKASKTFLKNLTLKFKNPEIKEKVKAEVKEKSRISIQSRLKELEAQIHDTEHKKPTQTKKKDMEL